MFKGWINQKFFDWREGKVGREASISGYAEWVGVSQQVMNGWIRKGYIPRSQNTVARLIDRYGSEVYDILGLQPQDFTPSDNQLRPLAEALLAFDPRLRPHVRRALLDTLTLLKNQGIDEADVDNEVKRRLLQELLREIG